MKWIPVSPPRPSLPSKLSISTTSLLFQQKTNQTPLQFKNNKTSYGNDPSGKKIERQQNKKLFAQIPKSNCGVSVLTSNKPFPASNILFMLASMAARGARDKDGNTDGNTMVFRNCEPYIAKQFPEYENEILQKRYQIVNAHMPCDAKTAKEAIGTLYYTFEQLGIPIIAKYEQPMNQSILLETDIKYPRKLTHFLIVKPDLIDEKHISAQDLEIFLLMGIDIKKPLSDFDFWRICQLGYLRILLHEKDKYKLDMIGVDQSLTFTSLTREEIIKDYYPEINTISCLQGIVQTRASTRTNVSMMGNHGGVRQENGENTNVAQIAHRIMSSPTVEKMLAFSPNLSSLPDTHVTSIYYVLSILAGVDPYESLARVAPFIDHITYKETPLTRLVLAAQGSSHQGPFHNYTRFPTPDGLKTIMHKDPNADRTGFGRQNSDVMQYGSSSLIELAPNGEPVSVVPGVPIILNGNNPIYLKNEGFQQQAQKIWENIPLLPVQLNEESSTLYSEEQLSAIQNANYLLTDKEDAQKEIYEKGELPSVAMGTKRAYTGTNPIAKIEFVRGTSPTKDNEHMGGEGALTQIIGRQSNNLSHSLCDLNYWRDCVRIESPILTPNQFTSIKNRSTSKQIVAVMPPFCVAKNMTKAIEQIANKVIEEIRNGAGIIILQDFDFNNFYHQIPLPHVLVFGHIQKRLMEENLFGVASLILHTNWATDVAELAPIFPFGCSAIYVEPIFSKNFVTSSIDIKKARQNWIKASEKILIDYTGGNGLQNFRCFVGNLSAVSLSVASADVHEFVGLNPKKACKDMNTFEKIASLWSTRFAITKTAQWTNTEKRTSPTAGKDTRNPQTIHFIKNKKYPEALDNILKLSAQPVDLIELNENYKPPHRIYHIYGLGPSGMSAFNKLWEEAQVSKEKIFIRIYYSVALGLGGQAIFPLHNQRTHGICQRTINNLQEALAQKALETIGDVHVTDEAIQKLKSYCHYDIDARGAPDENMPENEYSHFYTKPSEFYFKYSAGVTAPKTVNGNYRKPPEFRPTEKADFVGIIGGGDVSVDLAKNATLPTEALQNTHYIGAENRIRPNFAALMIYRKNPAQIPAGTHDLTEFEKQGCRVLAVFDKELTLKEMKDVPFAQQQKCEWWLKRWAGNSVENIPLDVIRGRTIIVLFSTEETGIVSSANSKLLTWNLKQKTSSGFNQFSYSVAYVVPCLGYKKITLPPVTKFVVGQRDPNGVGDISKVVTNTEKVIQHHLSEIKKEERPKHLPSISRVEQQIILNAAGFTTNTQHTINFLSSRMSKNPIPLDSQTNVLRAYTFNPETEKEQKTSAVEVDNIIQAYLSAKDIQTNPDKVIVHFVKEGVTLTFEPKDFNKNESVFSLIERTRKENIEKGYSGACEGQGTCGTCYVFDAQKIKLASDSMNVSPHKENSTLICTVGVEQALGHVYVVGSLEEIKEKVEKDKG